MTPLDNIARRKIKTREELAEILGPRPRKKSVIMCHGTFDIVHPGHIRHFLYCNEKADILVASLTSDVHITKGNFRPYVPEDLRAVNLAALEAVDYVIIDKEPTPIQNLLFFQPDFFAKGYEYSKEGVHPKTQEEIEALESYGGEIIFTPGDIVYSSSHFIELEPPKIAADKLMMLMKAENISFDDLRGTLDKFSGQRVHVVGDTIVDTYTHCTMIGGGTKTPTLSVKYDHTTNYSGGAAVVAMHLRAAGAEVEFSTVLGDDDLRSFVLDKLKTAGITCDPIIDKTRPTTQKNIIISVGHRLLKVDKLDNRTISEKILKRLSDKIKATHAEAIVFSDFRHGIFSHKTIPILIKSIPKGPLKVADSQVASRWGNILEFQGFDLITPNEREARFALGDQDSVIRPLALDLFQKANCNTMILKMGERGLITYRRSSPDPRAFFTVDSFVEKLIDPVGAGDALLAYSTLGLLVTKNEVIASVLGSMAAAVACQYDGNKPIIPKEVRKVLDLMERKVSYS